MNRFLFILVFTFIDLLNAKLKNDVATISSYIRPENILQNVRDFTSEPHLAGTDANRRVAEKIASKWRAAGLENVHFTKYKVLLSYPDFENPNHARLLNENGDTVFETSGVSPPLVKDEQNATNAGIQWLAYSADGKTKGVPFYAHFGRPEDFDQLEKLGIEIKGRIAIVRYGGAYRGNTVKLAKERGVIGVILFSDPADVAPEGTEDNRVYPNTDFMPAQAVQRGAVKKGDGDPLTPYYPSKSDLYSSITTDDLIRDRVIPNITVLPLGYTDVYQIISRLSGLVAPKEWQGGLNVTYKEIQNVIGYIKGAEEPDRYVMLSNHYDAWIYGSLDPNSGSAILSEMARAMKEAQNEGVYKPRRSVMFCNWDAEEFGVMGSNEFAEEFATVLTQRAVVLLNVDLIAGNATLSLQTVPSMYQTVVETAKSIETPTASEKAAGRPTLYDTWFYRQPGSFVQYPEYPEIKSPNDGSDHATFLSFLGIPVADFTYLRHDNNPRTNRSYPLYHSLYETVHLNQLIDSTFEVHAATGRFWAELARRFSETPVLPFNVVVFANILADKFVRQLKTDVQELSIGRPQLSLALQQVGYLIRNAQNFVTAANKFQSELNHFNPTAQTELQLRDLNDRLMLVERCFVSSDGLPNFPIRRNVLFSFSSTNAYSGRTMPGIYDAMNDVQGATSDEEKTKTVQVLTEQISHLQHSVQCATSVILSDP
ncbi:hypothetical protein M3Y98_00487900 [Aphelenchoides besseyi]|nr:hypothetical protein M3Y98_00487900 [Aphelenchoides besseyi]KAI6207653.1 hypothetical protein M3Y96_00031800 [Aphelenchoides besseyi]